MFCEIIKGQYLRVLFKSIYGNIFGRGNYFEAMPLKNYV